jgi:hypothetical protein
MIYGGYNAGNLDKYGLGQAYIEKVCPGQTIMGKPLIESSNYFK